MDLSTLRRPHRTTRRLGALLAVAVLSSSLAATVATAAPAVAAATPLTTSSAQAFDTLSGTGSNLAWADDATVPGWYATRATYTAGSGAGNAGGLYSLGSAGSTDRALGSVASGTTGTILYGARFVNDSASTIDTVEISYAGEQWREGGPTTTPSVAQTLQAGYQTGAAGLTSGTWTPLDALDFTSPVFGTTAAALDGNLAGNRTVLNATLTGLALAPGAELWLRWEDPNDAGNDHALAIDDVVVTVEVEPPGAGVVVSATDGGTDVEEGGVTDSYTLALSTTPSGPVTVTAAADAQTEVSLDGVTFGPSVAVVLAGSDPTTVTVRAVDDTADEGDHGSTVTHSITASADPRYSDELTPVPGLAVSVADDDRDECARPFTPASAIQGSGLHSPIVGQVVTTQGVVVGDYEGPAPALRGFYVQDATGDGDAATSDAVFVFNASVDSVAVGDVVRVTGTIAEFPAPSGSNPVAGQTQLGTVTAIEACGTGSVAPTDVTLPVASPTSLERHEGMLVRLPQSLAVTEHFLLGRFGQVTVSSDERLRQPTSVAEPGAAAQAVQAANDLDRIQLDDELNSQNPDPIRFGRAGQPLSAANTLRGGDRITGVIGVLTHTWGGNSASPDAYRVRPYGALGVTGEADVPDFQPVNPRPTTAPNVGGDVRVASLNLLNLFNTFTGCFNGCRGAENQVEYDRQLAKTVAAIGLLDADVLGLVELENDGWAPDSAVQALVTALNTAEGPGTYAAVDLAAVAGSPDHLGTDAIAVGVVYRSAAVTPVAGGALVDLDPVHNRPPVAVQFEDGDGARFTVVVNHLKSKSCEGATGPQLDQRDGQGCFNPQRVDQASRLVEWVAGTVVPATADDDVLLVGDLNSYSEEDPVGVLASAGYTNLVALHGGEDAYSYVFDGQWGYLDHAFASAGVLDEVTGAAEVHINADEPSVLDYNTNFKSPAQVGGLYAPDAYRTSDHDPVLVGLSATQPALSVSGAAVAEGAGPLRFTVTLSETALAAVTVGYATSDGTATVADGDYTPVAGTLTIPAGQQSATVAVPIADDTRDEPDETVVLTLGDAVGAIVTTASATGTVTDDDPAPSITASVGSAAEGDTGRTTLRVPLLLSSPSGRTVTVRWSTRAVTATRGSDFVGASGTASFAPGTTRVDVAVTVFGDRRREPPETFAVVLGRATAATVAWPVGAGVILDDDR